MMKQYEFRLRCTVDKLVTVEAKDGQEATDKANAWNVVDEQEVSMSDWNIESGPVERK